MSARRTSRRIGWWVSCFFCGVVQQLRDGSHACWQNHTMLRVKDAEKSLKFYQEVLGMSLFRTHESQAGGFTLYFLGYPGEKGIPAEGQTTADREGLLELTWNHGTEKDENFRYHDGNKEPQGFGHICGCRQASKAVCLACC